MLAGQGVRGAKRVEARKGNLEKRPATEEAHRRKLCAYGSPKEATTFRTI